MFSENEILQIVGRDRPLFEEDLRSHNSRMNELVASSRFLVVGGAGSIGGSVVREIFSRNPQRLHVIDISENNLAELVRDLRCSVGYIEGDFHAYCFDPLGPEFGAYCRENDDFDYILNLAALKHVRSEKDPFTLGRLLRVNTLLPRRLYEFAQSINAQGFFNVSTDKATNPVSMMGASKRLMECYLASCADSGTQRISARFANVAFSDGSLPHAWIRRIEKKQPIVAPNDIYRYFITEQEAGILCLLATLFAADQQIMVPKLSPNKHLTCFSDVAIRFLHSQNKSPNNLESEEDARNFDWENLKNQSWPCYFFNSSTSGEKSFEEFFDEDEQVDWSRFHEVGLITNHCSIEFSELQSTFEELSTACLTPQRSISDFVEIVSKALPEFRHHETGRHLDDRM